MPEPSPAAPLYHVLLIGIDAYPPGYNSLSGCVNDIDAIEQLLLDPPGVGVPPAQVRITRLAAPRPNVAARSRLLAQTLPPTKDNVVAALQSLAGPAIQPSDRVLIYYSGHGDQVQLTAGGAWHEAIVPHNGARIQYFYDVELNPLINAIAAHAADVTVILDSCHSAGATKDISTAWPGGAARLLQSPPGQAPDIAPVNALLVDTGGKDVSMRMLQSVDPSYFALAACQPEETAQEGAYEADRPHGNLTQSLILLLGPMNGEQRAQARWADLWSSLLESISTSGARLRQTPQHPAWTGRSERRVFGGAWQPMDVGYPLAPGTGGACTIGAGTLLGVTEGAELAVYGPPGPPPAFFLFFELGAIGSPKELAARRGMLRVTSAERATSKAAPQGASFVVAPGMRARLVKPGTSERLRVAIEPPDATLAGELQRSAFLATGPAPASMAEVLVAARAEGGWAIINDLREQVATVPANEVFALRAGLEAYARYNTVLRLAKNCQDPQLANCLSMRLLDCNDAAALAAADPIDPSLPEAPRDSAKVYALAQGARFCIQLTSTCQDRSRPLHASVFNCGAAGEVQFLGDATLRAGDRQALWFRVQQRKPFVAGPDFPGGATDRLIAIATTRQDTDLQWLARNQRVQAVIDESIGAKDVLGGDPGPAAPGELWTATVVPLRIGFGKSA